MLWTSRKIAQEIFGLTDEEDIKQKVAYLSELCKKGSSDFRYKRIGGRWFYDPESFTPQAMERPRRGRKTIMEMVLGGKG